MSLQPFEPLQPTFSAKACPFFRNLTPIRDDNDGTGAGVGPGDGITVVQSCIVYGNTEVTYMFLSVVQVNEE